MKETIAYNNIDEYIALYPNDVKELLEQVRETIRKAAPNATETINYGIPTFQLNGNLVHFAAYKKHIGFYPGAAGIAEFKDILTEYETSKGTVQFPLDKSIPYELISQITEFRVFQNEEKANKKKKK